MTSLTMISSLVFSALVLTAHSAQATSFDCKERTDGGRIQASSTGAYTAEGVASLATMDVPIRCSWSNDYSIAMCHSYDTNWLRYYAVIPHGNDPVATMAITENNGFAPNITMIFPLTCRVF